MSKSAPKWIRVYAVVTTDFWEDVKNGDASVNDVEWVVTECTGDEQ